ncbi:TetR family transcriptional regulator [Nocardia araoensis]|uniref:TetR family transcriptional regulator n=1 Tax=Nocardia araoensis TaxID=228600 RepID=UPI000303361F|nr:TetR family transcriptional regulator [Nocardia araoensis]
MDRTDEGDATAKILDAVVSMLESDGYDAVQLRAVARNAHVSLATVYKRYPTRDDLMLAAVERWMATNTYATPAPYIEGETLADGLMRLMRYVFEPWERNPRMLEAYYRARSGPGGRRLDAQGFDAVLPAASALLADVDPDYTADIALVLTNMIYALIGRFAHADLDIAEILPAMQRTVVRLTGNNEPLAAAAGSARRSAPGFPWSAALVSPFSPGTSTDPEQSPNPSTATDPPPAATGPELRR